jgi:4-methoxybenzoate monooxygenase (O-demethylating)
MMTPDAAVRSQSTQAPPAIPDVDADPFFKRVFENPHPIHEVLREAGPLVQISKWKVRRTKAA